jgi:hypothetical protein
MSKFKQNNVSINYEVYGTGKPIILLHGAIVDFYSNTIKLAKEIISEIEN